jgi:hypothetical protein
MVKGHNQKTGSTADNKTLPHTIKPASEWRTGRVGLSGTKMHARKHAMGQEARRDYRVTPTRQRISCDCSALLLRLLALSEYQFTTLGLLDNPSPYP